MPVCAPILGEPCLRLSSPATNLTITANDTLTNTGNYSINVGGNWSNSGTFTEGTSLVTFDTNSTATLNSGGTTAAFEFYAVTIDKSGGSLQLITNNLALNNNFILTAGTLDDQ